MEVDQSAETVRTLCVDEGLHHEQDNDIAGAMAIYEQALALAGSDHARCIAAHFMARNRVDAAEELTWNLRALELARNVGDDRVAADFASFLGCVGLSYERLGEPALARPYLEEGLRRLVDVPPGAYRDDVKQDIVDALKRTSNTPNTQD